MLDRKYRAIPCARYKQPGFTLIELMIVIVILSILLAIAFPAYQEYVRKARRADAKAMLLDMAARQEKYYSTRNTYTTSIFSLGYLGSVPMQVPSTTETNYLVSIVSATTGTFSLRAVPTGRQVGDACGTFTLDHTGRQDITGGSLSANECW